MLPTMSLLSRYTSILNQSIKYFFLQHYDKLFKNKFKGNYSLVISNLFQKNRIFTSFYLPTKKRYLLLYKLINKLYKLIIILMSLSVEDILAQPNKEFVIQTFYNNQCFLTIDRTNGSSSYNSLILQIVTVATATKWRLVKESSGNYGLICSKNGGCLQIPPGNIDGVRPFAGSNLALQPQKWIFKPSSGDSKAFFIETIFSNPKRVLDIHNYEYVSGSIVNAYKQNNGTDNNDRNQKWRFIWAY